MNTSAQTDEAGCEIVHGEAGSVLFGGVELVSGGILRVGAEESGLVACYGKWLGISNGIENHVK